MQKPCPQPLFQTPPAMKRTPESSRHYNWFVTKRSRLSTGTPLNCKDHPFFEDIVKIPEELKSFYNRVFLVNGDIFEDFMFECAPVKKLILEGIYQGLRKLKTFNIPNVHDNLVSKVETQLLQRRRWGSKLGGSTGSLGRFVPWETSVELFLEAQLLRIQLEELQE